MSDLIIANKTDFIEVANAIREKAGTSDPLAFPGRFPGMERTVLSEPITIPAGEAKLITYKITFNQTLS